jgi:ECF sigma factor
MTESPSTLISSRLVVGNDDAQHQLQDAIKFDLQEEISKRIAANDETKVTVNSLIEGLDLRIHNVDEPDLSATSREFYAVAVDVVAQAILDRYLARMSKDTSRNDCSHPLDDALSHFESEIGFDFQEFYHALEALRSSAPLQHRIITLQMFAGISTEQTAIMLETSIASVERDWRLARAKLHRYLWKQKDDAESTQ